MSQRNIDALKRFVDAINSGKLEALNELVEHNVVDHDAAEGQEPGAAGYIKFFSDLRNSFSNLKIEIKHTVADEHYVAMAYKMTGIHKGRFLHVPPTGHTIIVRGMMMGRFYGGRLVERWGVIDELGILEQLGAVEGRNRVMA
jgi:steroid delta-isomerase-like uncharacterized protein